ncbi:MAG: NUDIX hydrolase [Deltaproteobacteria bacterium]|nr:NUDIX hydrolase [Deltaproteobacteria bacterium]
MKREYPDQPLAGVGGVIFRDDRVLIVQRGQEPGKGQWSLPGGLVELGETLTDALKREVLEETSLRIEIGGFVRLLDRIVHDDHGRIRFHYVIGDYWGWVVEGSLKPGSDISDARFMALDRLEDQELHPEVVETILEASELYRKDLFSSP